LSDAVYVAVVADLHINSSVALCPPVFNLDEGGTFRSSKGQRWLWEHWLSFWQEVKGLEGRRVAILNGDIGELDIKRRSYQLISPNKAMILKMVLMTLEPMLEAVDEVIVLRGTMAHIGKSAWLEEMVGNDLTIARHDPVAGSGTHPKVTGKVRVFPLPVTGDGGQVCYMLLDQVIGDETVYVRRQDGTVGS
jgi:hypothetical protein